tara:strand:- start:67 stop:468 length:402 start_codon:yes stop_codon:yes gene_type:complete
MDYSYSNLKNKTNNSTMANKTETKPQTLPNIIKNISFHFIKINYNKYLEDNKIEEIPKERLEDVVCELYDQKQTELKKYIRGTLRRNFPDFDQNFSMKTSTEEILLEMFEDPDFAKNRIVLEIEAYQESKKKE